MRHILTVATLFFMTGSAFADGTINSLNAGTTVTDTDLFPGYQGSNPAVKVTAAQIAAYAAQAVCAAGFTGVSGQCVWTKTANNTATSLAWAGLAANEYDLRCSGIIASNATNTYFVQFGEGGTPTWETSGYIARGVTSANGVLFAHDAAGAGMEMPPNIAASGTNGLHAIIHISGLQSAYNKQFSYTAYSDAALEMFTITGAYTADANVITAIRLIDTASHNITSGSCTLVLVN